MANPPVAGAGTTPGAPQQNWFQKHPWTWMSGIGLGGAGLGALGGLLSGGGLGGQKAKTKQLPLYNEQGMSAINQLLSQGMQNADFGGIENLARKNFMTQTVPSLAEAFTSMGGGAGGQRSSAFQGALGSAGSDLESQLAALRGQFGMQQLGMGLRPTFENMYQPSQPGFGQQLATSGMQGLTSLLPLLALL